MSVTERQRAALSNRSPKNAQRMAPDPTWKAQQAFIRATRRGSRKRSGMEQKGELLLAALDAIPARTRLQINPLDGKPTAPERMPVASPRARAAVSRYLAHLTKDPK